MAEYDLEAAVRDRIGKQPAKRFRSEGYVPGVMYGHGETAVPIAVEGRTFTQIMEKSRGVYVIFNLKIEGHDDAKAVLKEVQRDPVSREVIHIDFQHIHPGEPLTVQVPVVLTGSSPGVKEGGILEHIVRKVGVKCLPSQIPDHFKIDINDLMLGHSVHVKDLEAGPVRILDDAETTVVSVLVPRAKVEVAVAEEEVPEEEVSEEEKEEAAEEKEKEGEEKEGKKEGQERR